MWSSSEKVMVYGDGDFPFFPDGFRSFTSLDIGAHEMSHGVMNATANLTYRGESGGLNEANSDIMAMAVLAYAQRTVTDPPELIPSAELSWAIGEDIKPDMGPLRRMDKPSADGLSPDAWFHGVSMLDVHYSSGPANRMFHFLVEGAPSDASSVRHSPYLPEGMSGIGIDKATRIWFKAVTEQFTTSTPYAAARAGCIKAATDLYGEGSPELAAVENAFGAINVGPAHGKATRPLVTFPNDLVDPNSRLAKNANLGDIFLRTPIVPVGEVVQLHAKVEHATDPAVSWKAGIARGFYAPSSYTVDVTATNGSFDEDGRYHAPRVGPTWTGVRAFSKQDPLSFGASLVYVARLDSDGDSEQDAVDQGVLALTWGLSAYALNEISPYPDPETKNLVDDYSLQMWSEGFHNAYAL
jgi:Thermolysin metallopeptidase, alpha-helical domain/Thermolysin metallopeptidase, catalytic domain